MLVASVEDDRFRWVPGASFATPDRRRASRYHQADIGAAAAASSAASSTGPGEAVAVSSWHWNMSLEQAGIESHPRAPARRPHHDVHGAGARHLVANYPLVEGRTSDSHRRSLLPLGSGRAQSSSLTTWTKTRAGLLRGGRISAVLHHDLRQDVRQACSAIMQAHKALPVPFTPRHRISMSLRHTTCPHLLYPIPEGSD